MTRPYPVLKHKIKQDIERKMEELAMKETAINTALDATSIFMQNEDERLAYLNREMAIMDYESDKEAWTTEARDEERKAGIRAFIAGAKALAASPAQVVEQLVKNYPLTEAVAQAAVQANW